MSEKRYTDMTADELVEDCMGWADFGWIQRGDGASWQTARDAFKAIHRRLFRLRTLMSGDLAERRPEIHAPKGRRGPRLAAVQDGRPDHIRCPKCGGAPDESVADTSEGPCYRCAEGHMWIYGETPGKFHTSTGGEVAVVSPAEAAEGRTFAEGRDDPVLGCLTSVGSALDEIERGREKLKKMKGGGE
jgi:hypothetical protein